MHTVTKKMHFFLLLSFGTFLTISCEIQPENENFELYPTTDLPQGRDEGIEEEPNNFISSTAIRVASKLILDYLETQGLTVSRFQALINLFREENLDYAVDVSQRAVKLAIQAGTLVVKYFPRENPIDWLLHYLANLKSRFAFYNIVDYKGNNSGPYIPDRIVKIVDYVTKWNQGSQGTVQTTSGSKGDEHEVQNNLELAVTEGGNKFAYLPYFEQSGKFNEHNSSFHDSLKFLDDSRVEGSKYESLDKIPLQQLPVYAKPNEIDSYGVPVKK